MTLIEVICAVWVFAVLGSASMVSWVSAIDALSQVEAQRSADDCADNAAEAWLSNTTIRSDTSGMHPCTVIVTPPAPLKTAQSGAGSVVTIVARVAGKDQTLELPQVQA